MWRASAAITFRFRERHDLQFLLCRRESIFNTRSNLITFHTALKSYRADGMTSYHSALGNNVGRPILHAQCNDKAWSNVDINTWSNFVLLPVRGAFLDRCLIQIHKSFIFVLRTQHTALWVSVCTCFWKRFFRFQHKYAFFQKEGCIDDTRTSKSHSTTLLDE